MTDTFTWISDETRPAGRLLTVDFANILVATSRPRDDEGSARASPEDSSHSFHDLMSSGDLDACDGILAQERLEDAEWVDWSEIKRGLQGSD